MHTEVLVSQVWGGWFLVFRRSTLMLDSVETSFQKVRIFSFMLITASLQVNRSQ
jgi:hypothetical protein